MVSNTMVRFYLTCLLVFTLACTKAQEVVREPVNLREEVKVETSIFTVIYSETKEQQQTTQTKETNTHNKTSNQKQT